MNYLLLIVLIVLQVVPLFFLNKKFIKRTGENKGSYNTPNAVHALIFALFSVIVCPFILWDDYQIGGDNTHYLNMLLHIMISFFISHLIFLLSTKKFLVGEFLHHIVIIAVCVYSLKIQKFAPDLVMTLFLGELTFVFQAKIIAQNMNKEQLAKKLDTVFIVLFPFIRVVIFPTYLYYFMQLPELNLVVVLVASSLVVLGLYWSFFILQRVLKK